MQLLAHIAVTPEKAAFGYVAWAPDTDMPSIHSNAQHQGRLSTNESLCSTVLETPVKSARSEAA